jgi:aspartyl-tRNA(Asn)/glutamyl-tRNA(Gln) amidotransferase subunit A
MSEQWLKMSAAALGRGIGGGEICPVTLAEAYLDAAERCPDQTRIYARLTRSRALDEATAARSRARAGLRRGVLDGVPVSWKDLFDTAGIATEAGSALLKGRMPATDCDVVRKLSAAGMVCLGKTHMSELAFSGLGLNPVTATPPCINDPKAVPGGSSSGAAASVAFGLAPVAIGSDTGGSVRIPSAWNDLVGLKTTSGLLSLQGVVPLAAKFDTVGPLARTVEDAALVFAALVGRKAPDLRGASLNGMRFLVLETMALDDLREQPAKGFEAALAKFAAAGAQISHGPVQEVADAMDLAGVLFTSEAYGLWRDVIEANPGLMFPRILERFRTGEQFSGPDYVAAWAKLDQLRVRYDAATAGFDAVLVPTAANLPPDAQRLMDDADYYVAENLISLRNTRIGNMMGGCALTLPTGVPSVGISLMAQPLAEDRLLRIGAAAEAALA